MTLDIGLDIHISLPSTTAAEYAGKRAEVLLKRRSVLAERERKIEWEIQQFEGALHGSSLVLQDEVDVE